LRGDNTWQDLDTAAVPENGNLYFTNARARAALSVNGPLSYNSGTGVFSISQANTSTNGYLASADWNTFNSKQDALTFGSGLTNTANTITNNLVVGVVGGQTIVGGTAASDNLILQSTSDATKGYIVLNPNGGNVGVGTSTPSQKFDVAGAIRLGAAGANNVLNTSAAGGAPTGTLYFGNRELCDSSGNCAGSGAGLGGSGNQNYLAKFSGTFAVTDSILYDDGTNIGIGTTTPGAKLDVAGGIRLGDASANNILNTVAAGGAPTGALYFGNREICTTAGNCSGSAAGVQWGDITGTLSNQTDLQNALNAKEDSLGSGTAAQYLNGEKTWQTLDTSVVPESTNLYYTQGRFDTAFAAKTTTNLTEGTNLYYTQGRFDTAFAAKSTTDLTEGTNLYYTTARFDTRFSTKSTTDLTEGTNLYYTNARARAAVSAAAPLSYNSSTGQFSIAQANGSTDGYLSAADWTRFDTAAAGELPSGGTTSQYLRGDNTWQALSSTVVAEGTNLYYTQARFDTAFAAKSTTDLTEGTNQYFTTARARASISGTAPISYNSSTGAISMAAATGTTDGYLSAADWTRFDSAAAGELPSGGTTSQYLRGDNSWQTLSTTVVAEGTNLYYTEARFSSSFSGKTTTDLTEGTNLYFTTARARSSISASGPLGYNNTTGVLSLAQSTGTTDGYLSAEDWARFDTAAAGELPAGGTTSQYLRGDNTWQTLSTTVVAEGTNLYWTAGRFDTAFGTKSTTDLSEGTNLYYTNARARAAMSGTAPITYNASTGAIGINQATGSTDGYLSAADWTRFDTAAAGELPSGGTTSQYLRGDNTWQTLSSTIVAEGTNLYYTQGRFDTAFAAKSTTDLGEGTNLYFTTARARAVISGTAPISYNASTGAISIAAANGTTDGYLSAADWTRFDSAAAGELPAGGTTSQYLRGDNSWQTLDTTAVAEGTNLYYTDARFDTRFGTKTTTDLSEGANLYWTSARFNTAFDAKTTTDLDEGTNLYFTEARARAALSATSPLSYNSTTGAFSIAQATDSTNGYLSSGDWNIFNNKQDILTFSTGLTNTTGTITANLSTGVAGGQTLIGGTSAGDDLIIQSTTNASRGDIILNPNGGYVGVGTATPGATLDIAGSVRLGAAGSNNVLNTSAAGGAPTGSLYWGNRTVCDSSGNCPSGITGSGSANQLAIWNGSGGLVSDQNLYWDSTAKGIILGSLPTASYANTGGSGSRTSNITISSNVGLASGSWNNLIDGSQADVMSFANQSAVGKYIQFDFGLGAAIVITEIKWYQDGASQQGPVLIEGSNDGSSWTSMGNSVYLGSAATTTITELASNTTAYRYYRFYSSSGSYSWWPWIREVEFKLYDASVTPNTVLANNFLSIGSSVVNSKLQLIGTAPTAGNPLAYFNETSTNDILKLSVSGSAKVTVNNSGYLGIGDSTPAAPLTIGNGDLFQVNSSGQIAAAAGITSSGTINFSGLNANSMVFTDASKNLTTTGTVGVGSGGTGTTTAFTQGSVVFAGASGVYSQDNANFFFDDTTNRLGLGTASPSQTLDVAGAIRLGAAGANNVLNTTAAGGAPTGSLYWGDAKVCTANDACASSGSVGGSGTAGQITYWAANGTDITSSSSFVWDSSNTRLGIGGTPSYTLDILSTSANQFRLGYNTSNYILADVSSIGLATFDAVGTSAGFRFNDNITVASGTMFLGIGGTTNGQLTINSSGVGETAPVISANSTGDLLINAPTGVVNVGSGTGDIIFEPVDNNMLANLSGTGSFLIMDGGVGFVNFDSSSQTTFDYPTATGTALTINGNTLTTGAATRINTNSLTTGQAFSVASSSNQLSSGNLMQLAATSSSTSVAYTGSIASASLTQTITGGTGLNSTGNVANFSRNITLNNSGQTYTLSGEAFRVSDSFTQTAGTFSITSNTGLITRACPSGVTCSGSLLQLSATGTGTDTSGLSIRKTAGTMTNGIVIGSGSEVITNGLVFGSTGIVTDITLHNGATINNDVAGTVRVNTTTFDLSGLLRLGAAGANNTLNTSAAGGAPTGSLFWGNRTLCDSSGNCASGLTGTGSANQIAFWNGAGTSLTTNSNLFWDNTNNALLVGTSTSQSASGNALVVRKDQAAATRIELNNANAAGYTNIRYYQGATAKANTYYDNALNEFVLSTSSASAPMKFQTNDTTRFVVGDTGIAIGSTTYADMGGLGENFRVRGDTVFDDGYNNTLEISPVSGGVEFRSRTADNITPGHMDFKVHNTSAMYIDSTAKIGIGVSSTLSAQIESRSTTEQLRLAYNASTYASFTVDSSGKLSINSSGGVSALGLSSTELTLLDQFGNGSQMYLENGDGLQFAGSSTYEFGVTGLSGDVWKISSVAAGASGNVLSSTATLNAMNGTDTVRGLFLDYTNANHTGSGNTLVGIDIDGITGDADATEIGLRVGAGWDYAAVFDGSVGIGTATPSQALDVTGAIRLGAAGSNNVLNTTAAGGAPSGSLYWGSREICDTSGNCAGGASTWSRNAVLGWVYPATITDKVSIGSSSINTTSMLAVNGGVSLGAYAVDSAPSNGLIVSGNVGIATNNPGAALTVGSNAFQVNSSGNIIRINGLTYNWPSSHNGANKTLVNDGSGGLTWQDPPTSTVGWTRTAGVVKLSTTADKVDIGITSGSPQSILAVAGNVTIGGTYASANNAPSNGLLVQGNTSIGTTSNQNRLDVSGNMAIGSYAGGNAAPSNGLIVSGAVGIGTNSPTASMALHVDGRMMVDLSGTATTKALCHSRTDNSNDNAEIVDCNGTPAADYMEFYSVDTDAAIGDIVVASNSYITTKDGERVAKLSKSTMTYQPTVIGIVSDKSKAGDFNSIGHNIKTEDNPQPIALSGRVPVKVSQSSLPIAIGDLVTTSNEPGKGMKATGAGFTVGRALEEWTPESGKSTVMVFVSYSFYSPESVNASLWSISEGRVTATYNVSIDGNISAKQATFTEVYTQILNINNGKLTIDRNGKLVANGGIESTSVVTALFEATEATIKSLKVDKLAINQTPEEGDATIGSGKIEAGKKSLVIENVNVTENAKIFVTVTSRGNNVLNVIKKTAGESFEVELGAVTTTDVTFDYWIVGE
jgi:hypothetical protein